MPTTRKVTAADVPRLAATLARAFDDDPVVEYLFPDPARRRARLPRFFAATLRRIYLGEGESYTTDDLAGGALWARPGGTRSVVRDALRYTPVVPLLGRRVPAALRLLGAIDARRPRDAEHFYLGVLGTDPSRQGQGVGSALLAPVLERCDREGVPAYLESSKERNVPFYARHGFAVTDELAFPGGPRLWLMWREPRP